MTQRHFCPRCSTPLAADAPASLCPNCLFQLALESSTAALDPQENSDQTILPYHLTMEMETFGDYELLQEIARGGMGVVYKARQRSLNRIVALKMMLPSLSTSAIEVQRFRTEAEAAANLQHPNIVSIHEVGEHDGRLYFSMDYIEGQSLASLIRAHPLPAETAAHYLKTTAEAVHYAHRQGFLHRDLKPSNILVDETHQPRITDFGLAKRMESDSRLTITGSVLGTPSYMSPEQAAGKSDQVGPASEVYSLGTILYELLTGRPPFQAATPMDTVLLVLNADPVPPQLLIPKLNRDLETICLKCLEKEPRRRYQSAQELADDLNRYLTGKPIIARPINRVNRAWRWCRRNPWPTTATAALFLLAALALVSAFTYRERLWQSLLDRVRLERLAGNRAKSLEAAAEAARIKQSPMLFQEATQSITTPGVILRHQLPYANPYKPIFSPDSKMLAFRSEFGEKGERISPYSEPRIVVWEVNSGKLLDYIEGDTFAFAPYVQSPLPIPIPNDGDKSAPSIAVSGDRATITGQLEPYKPVLAVSKATHHFVDLKRQDGSSYTEDKGIKDHTVRLRDPVTRKDVTEPRNLLQCCNEYIAGPLLFSPDDLYLVKGSYDTPIWIFNRYNHTDNLICDGGEPITFISDKELLLNLDGRIQNLNITNPKPRFVTPSGMTALTVSAIGQIAILQPDVSGQSSALTVWDIKSNRKIGLLPLPDKNKPVLQLSYDGRLAALYSEATPTLIYLWDMRTTTFRQRITTLGSNTVIYLDESSFSPDGSMLAVFGISGAKAGIWILDTENGSEVAVLRDNHSPVWSNDSRLLSTAGPGRLNPERNGNPSIAYSKNGVRLENTILNVWSVTPPIPTYLLSARIDSITFGTNPTQLVSNGVIWETSALDKFTTLKLTPLTDLQPIHHAFFDKSNSLWASNFERKEFPLKFWQLSPEKREIVLESPDYSEFKSILGVVSGELVGRPMAFAISPDGKFLVMSCQLNRKNTPSSLYTTSAGESTLELWSLDTQKRLAIWNEKNIKDKIDCISFSPDGRRVAVCSPPGVKIWDATSGKLLRTLRRSSPASMIIFSPDSRLIFSSSISPHPEIAVNEVDTGREIGMWRGHESPVNALAVHPDGHYLASAGEDRMICLWEIPDRAVSMTKWQDREGHLLNRWEAHSTPVTALAFSPVWGYTLVSGAADGTLKLWQIPSINKELETLGMSSKKPFPSFTVSVLAMLELGYLIIIIGLLFQRRKPNFKWLTHKLVFSIGSFMMITGILLMYFIPGVIPWLDYSTSDYATRLIFLALSFFALYLFFGKRFNLFGLLKN